MVIGTGYFAQTNKYVSLGYAPISIALKQPWFVNSIIKPQVYDKLAPTKEILGLKDNPEEYTRRYKKEILGEYAAADVYRDLVSLSKRTLLNNIVLLCWEGIGKFCHRNIVANWLGDYLGEKIDEINVKPTEETLL